MKLDQILGDQLVKLLQGDTHMSFKDTIKDFPEKNINTRPPHVEYSFWHLIEHLRLTQLDLLEYSTNPNYKEPKWPTDYVLRSKRQGSASERDNNSQSTANEAGPYWSPREADATPAQWHQSITDFEADLQKVIALVQNPDIDLTASVPTKPKHTILRSMMHVADHNSYHIGELASLRQVVNNWPKDHDK